MGDVGSTYLGSIYAALILNSESLSDALCLLLVASPLIYDALFCLLRRFFSGHAVFRPHRLHLYQRLIQAGWSHSNVSLAYIIATGTLAFAMHTGGLPWVFGLSFVVFLLGIWLDQRVALPFALASSK